MKYANDGGLGAAGADARNSMGTSPVGSSPGSCAGDLPEVAEEYKGGHKNKGIVSPMIRINATKKSAHGPKFVLVQKPYGPSKQWFPGKKFQCPRTKIDLWIVLRARGKDGTVEEPPETPKCVSTFDGKRTLTIVQPVSQDGTPCVRFEDFNGHPLEKNWKSQTSIDFSNHEFPGILTIYAVGLRPSAAIEDIQLTLSLVGSDKFDVVDSPASDSLTSIEVTLDICQSRTSKDSDPSVMPLPTGAAPLGDKISPGRFVHLQDASYQHGRAMLIVRVSNPEGIPLDLKAFDNRAHYFTEELAAAGQVPVTPTPYSSERKFWAEGAQISKYPGDTGFALGIEGLGYGDWVAMTVVQFKHLAATIPATPPRTPRDNRSNIPGHHVFEVDSSVAVSDDFSVNQPLVLIENSVAQFPLNLTVKPKPLTDHPFAISWSVERDVKDSPQVAKWRNPGLDPDSKNKGDTRRLMSTDSAGSFHIRAYISCNSDGEYHGNDVDGNRIDCEPSIIMNLVLVRVTLVKDDSPNNDTSVKLVTHPENFNLYPIVVEDNYVERVRGQSSMAETPDAAAITPDAAAITPDAAAIYMCANILAIGGGPDGTLGVDQDHFGAGWIQTWEKAAPSAKYKDDTGKVRRFRTKKSLISGKLPALDTERDSPGTGGETATLIHSKCSEVTPSDPVTPGQFFVVDAIDGPDVSGVCRIESDDFEQLELIYLAFQDDFHTALCVWTSAIDRLYNVVYQFDWSIHAEWKIDMSKPMASQKAPIMKWFLIPEESKLTTSPSEPVANYHRIEVRSPVPAIPVMYDILKTDSTCEEYWG
jgi:hypothetical protein